MGLEHVNDVDSLWMHRNRSIMDPLTRCIDATMLLRRPLDILVFILSESQIRNEEIGPHCKKRWGRDQQIVIFAHEILYGISYNTNDAKKRIKGKENQSKNSVAQEMKGQ